MINYINKFKMHKRRFNRRKPKRYRRKRFFKKAKAGIKALKYDNVVRVTG